MVTEKIAYQVGGTSFVGALVYDDSVRERRPLLLVSPNWLGVTPEAIERTGRLAGRDYIGFVADMYGGGKTASGPEDAGPLADALRNDAPERRRRIKAALDALATEAERRRVGDRSRAAAVGFCFGGGNVLELARIGAEVQAVVCLHGDLTTPLPAEAGDIRAKLLVIHGSADPVSPKAQRDALEAEMEAAGACWQLLMFGGLVHSFCEEDAAVPGIAEYNPAAARQSFRLLQEFIADAFANRL